MTPIYTKKIITLKKHKYKPQAFPITPIHILKIITKKAYLKSENIYVTTFIVILF